MILIITEKTDIHPNSVIEILNKKNISFFRLNTDWLLSDYKISYFFNHKSNYFIIKDLNNDKVLNSKDIISVWERRPSNLNSLTINANEDLKPLITSEVNEFLRFIRYDLHEKFSIGNSVHDKTASSKILQLRIAQELGLKVPKTCFSNNKNSIIDFFYKSNSDVVIKPIDIMSYNWNDVDYTFFTRKIDINNLIEAHESSFSSTVSFFQEYIHKAFELRVTVVCNQVFACKIDSQIQADNEGKIDWRQGYDYGIKHSIFDLPSNIAEFCHLFLKRMQLNFGCFDFIVTPNNEYVFLECNSNGQWAWLEDEVDLHISEAIADALIRGGW